MTHRSHRNTFRRLVVSSALAGSLFAFAGSAHGQTLPGAGDVVMPTIPNGAGNSPVINPTGTPANTLLVQLRANNTVINWNGFNVPAGDIANFTDNTGGAVTPIAVLNRDVNVSSNISQILGTLKSDSNVAVWVYNPNGILVGNNAAINVGGLVLTTLDIDNPTNFNGSGDYNLATAAGSTAKIQVGAGATITTTASVANRAGLVLVAPQIDAAGAIGTTFDGGNSEVAFVAATDVRLQYDFGSPLAITINKGTAFNGTSIVAGTISGRNVFFAIASQSTVTDALLQVDADATAATTSNRGIVLLGGQTSVTGSGVTVATGGGTDTSGAAGITANGALVSGNKMAAAATGAVTIAGAVTAETNYAVTGKSVTLGSGTTALQQAKGTATITATNGDITGKAGLTLRSNSDNDTGLGAEALTLDVTGGDIALDAGSALQGGSNKQSDVLLHADALGSGLSLGDVKARSLQSWIGLGLPGDIVRDGTITLGNLNLASDLTVTSNAGNVSAGGITLTGLLSDAKVTATAGDATVTGAVDVTGDYLVTGQNVTLGDPGGTATLQQAQGAATIKATAGNITGRAGLTLRSNSDNDTGLGAETLTLDVTGGGIAFAPGSALQGGSNKQSDVRVNVDTIASDLSLGDVKARNLLNAIGGGATSPIVRTGTVTLGNVDLAGSLAVTSNTGDVSVGAISVTNPGSSIKLISTVGALNLPALANLTADGDIELQSANALAIGTATSTSGHVTVTSGAGVTTGALGAGTFITVGASGPAQISGLSTGAGNAQVTASGAATVNGPVTVAGNYLVTGAGVTLGGTQSATGAVTIESTGAGNLSALSGLALTANSDGIGTELMSLKTGGGLALGGSTLTNTAGTVRFITPSDTSAFVVGNVSALQLSQQIGAAAPVDGTIARTGAITFGDVTTGSALTLSSLFGTLAAGAISSPGAINLTGTTVTATSATSTAGPVNITANTGDLAIGTVSSGGTATLKTLGATGDIRVDTATAAGTLTVSSVGGVRGNSGTRADLTSTGGDLTVTASNTATATLGTASAANNLSVTAGTIDVLTPSATAGSLTLNAVNGSLTVGTISAPTGVTLNTSGDLIVGSATSSAGNVSLTSTAGNTTIGDITAATSVLVSAAGIANVTGNVTAGTTYSVAGASVNLGVDPGTELQQAKGAVTITANSGLITGGTGLTLLGNSDNAGAEDVTFNLSPVGIDFSAATIEGGTTKSSRIFFGTSVDTTPVTLGSVTASSFGSTGDSTGIYVQGAPIIVGNLDMNSVELVGASVTTGSLSGGGGLFGLAAYTGNVAINGSVNVTSSFIAETLGGGGISISGLVTASDILIPNLGTPGSVTGGNFTATAGNISIAGSSIVVGNLGATGSVTLSGAISDVTAADIAAGTAVSVSAAGVANVTGNVTAGTTYSVTGASVNLGVDPDAELQQAAGAVTITANSGLITGGTGLTLLGNSDNAGAEDVTFNLSPLGINFSAATIEGGTTKSSRIFFGTSVDTTPVTLGNVTGASFGSTADGTALRIQNAPITVGNLDMASAVIVGASVTTGSLSGGGGSQFAFGAYTGGVAINGPVNITSPLIVQTLAGGISFGGSVTATSIGVGTIGTPAPVTGGNFTATAGDITMAGSSVTVGDLSATGAIALNGTTSDVTATSATAGSNVTVTSAGAVTLAGNVTAGGDYKVTGATVALGVDGDAETQKAAGKVDITSTTGAITSGAGLTLQSNSDGVGTEYLVLDSAGDINFDPSSTLLGGTASQSNVGIRFSGASGALTLGSVTALGLSGVDAGRATFSQLIVPGNLTVAGPLVVTNKIDFVSTTGNISLASATVSGAGQGISLKTSGPKSIGVGSLTAPGAITLDTGGTGAATATAIDGSNITVTGASINLTTLTTPGAITLTSTSGDIVLGSGHAGTSATLTASQAISFTTLTTGTDATLIAGTDITGDTLNAGNVFTANAGGTVAITHTSANGVGVIASEINLPTTNVTGSLSLTSTVGGITLGGGSAGTAANFNAATTLDITAPFTSGGAMTLVANGAATVGALTSTGGAISLTAGSVSADSIDAATTLLVKTNAGDATVTGPLKAGGLLTVDTSGNATLAGVESTGGDLAITTGGALNADSLKSDVGAIGVTSATIAVGSADTGTSLSLKSTGGSLSIDTANAGTTATLDAAGPLSVTTGLTAVGDVSAIATGPITAALIKSTGGNATVSGVSADLAEADAAGLLKVTTTGGDLKLGQATAGSTTLNATGPLTVTGFVHTTGDASATATGAATIADIESSGGAVSITGATVDATTANALNGLTITSTTGQLTLGTGTAGTATLNSAGDAAITSLITSGAINVTATGAVAGGLIKSTGGGVTIGALSADLTEADTAGLLKVTTTGGELKLGQATAGSANLTAAGPLTVTGFVHTTGDASVTATGGATIADIESSGGAVSITGSTVDAGTIGTATALALTATAGDLSLGAQTAGTTLTLSATGDVQASGALASGGDAIVQAGGNAHLVSVAAGNGSVSVTAGGAVTGAGGGRVDLAATGAGHGVTVTAGTQALLGTVTASGDVKVSAATIDSTTARSTSGALTLNATGGALTVGTAASGTTATLASTGALNVTTLQSGGAATVTATGAATLGTSTTGGDFKVTAAGITAGATNVTGALTFTSTGDLALSQANVSGAATLDTTGRVTLGTVTASPSLTVKATDATLGGALKAGTVALVNRGTGTLRLGDGAGSDGFQLSVSEINLIDADKLTLDGGTGPVAIGALAFGANAGRTNVDVLTTGAMSVADTVSGSGTGRTFRFGGTAADDTAQASEIRIVATANGGGRLLFAGSGLDLRGGKIVLGQSLFVNTVMSAAPETVPGIFVGNPNSSLYNAALSGGVYDPTNQTVLSASTLSVRYTSFALFQNTGPAGTNAGVVLGGLTSAPVNGALTLKGPGTSTPNSFALFGTINGVSGTATAVLGSSVISVNGVNLPNSRVNGCIIGSGAGCLTTTITQPSLNVFDSSRLDIFRSADDFSLPFDPVVGSNNEALFAGISAIDAPVNPKCPDSKSGSCPAPEEK